MLAGMDNATAKTKVLAVFHEAASTDLSVSEAAKKAHVSPNTASTYIKVLVAEGFLEETRRIGNAKLFRLKQRERG